MAVIVVVIAGPAANFGRSAAHQRNNGVIGNTAALNTMIVNDVP